MPNHSNPPSPFVKIPLTQGKVALVSPEDAELVLSRKWSVRRDRKNIYTQSYIRGSHPGELRYISIHRLLMPDAIEVDHINGNGLDCRRGNLRQSSRRQNGANNGRNPGVSGYRGVRLHGKKWAAQITQGNGRHRGIGVFDTPEEAARAFDDAARAIHGEYARLNFPRDGERGV